MITHVNKELMSWRNQKKKLTEELEKKDQEISSLISQINAVKKHLMFADTIIARLSNDCLRKKYDSKSVNEAIYRFTKIYTPELQNKFSPVMQMLQDYNVYYFEIVEILQTAQSDSNLGIPTITRQTANSYITKIKNSRYYLEHYRKNWNIPFLEKLIDSSIKKLQVYDPMKSDEIILIDFKP